MGLIMGGICAGGIPGVPSAPEIELDMEAVGGAITDALKALPENIADNRKNFPTECAKLEDGAEYDVPDTTMKLKKDANEQEIWKAAIVAACGTALRDSIKDAVWGQFEPKIDEQLDAVDGLPDAIKNKAKDKFKEATIDPLVDKAVDEALAAAEKEMGGDDASGDKVEEEAPKDEKANDDEAAGNDDYNKEEEVPKEE